jgi:hypothetical protein
MSPEQQRLFTEYLYDRDPQFKAAVNKYRAELSECRGAAEVHYVQNKVIKEFSGSYGEKLVYHALRPLAGNIKTQERTVFPDGSYTKTDIIFEDLKVPMILGKGEGMSAHVGGNIAVEVKIGQPAYIYSQKDHMVFQAGGHKDASASAVICSRDIKKLSEEKENILRSAMREAGSPIIGMLPEKNEIDSACWEIVRNGALKEDENI